MESPDFSFGFFIYVDEKGIVQTHYQRKKLPVEIAMVQLRALLDHLEKPYFDNFSSSISSAEYKD